MFRNLSRQETSRRGDEAWKDAASTHLSSGWEASAVDYPHTSFDEPEPLRAQAHQTVSVEQKRGFCVPSRLHEFIWCVLPCPALRSEPLAGGLCVNLTQLCFYQAEGLLNEVVELVDRGPRVDTDDGEELFEARGKVGRRHLHLVHQSILPAPARIVEAVQSREDEQEVLLAVQKES